MEVLVTGGAGYVGCVSVDALIAAGHEAVVLDDLVTGHRGGRPPGRTRSSSASRMRRSVGALLETRAYRGLLHCAARSLVGETSATRPLLPGERRGRLALLEAGEPPAWIASSSARPRPSTAPRTRCRSRRTPPPPINPYGATKLAFEAARAGSGAHGLRQSALRYFNVAGASDGRRGP